jgi:hypothetical protein
VAGSATESGSRWASIRFHAANSLGLSKHLLDRPAESFHLNLLGRGYSIRLRPYNGDWFIFLNTMFGRRYAPVAELINPIQTVIELGCHVGSSTLSLALLAPQAQFFCLEANPGNAPLAYLQFGRSRFAGENSIRRSGRKARNGYVQ